MKVNYLVLLIVLLSLLAGLLVGWKISHPNKLSNAGKIIINQHAILIEVVDTPEKIAQGLSDRPEMPKNHGMLFLLGKSDYHTFWMNKMKFNLDFVFINGNQIVDLAENIPYPKSGETPANLSSKVPFDKVLEINAGQIKNLGIKIGHQVQFP